MVAAILKSRERLSAQDFLSFGQALASDNLNVTAVMKDRHDLQTDVAMRVGNDAHDQRGSFLVAQVHRFFDMRRASDIH